MLILNVMHLTPQIFLAQLETLGWELLFSKRCWGNLAASSKRQGWNWQ